MAGELSTRGGEDGDDAKLMDLRLRFKAWCKEKRLPTPRGMLSLRLIGWGDSRADCPELASSFKAET
eukprot:12439626-Alexandrium_andersonii.AAC.1